MRNVRIISLFIVCLLLLSLNTSTLAMDDQQEIGPAEDAEAELQAAANFSSQPHSNTTPDAPIIIPGDVVYFSDFEADNGGMIPTLDWIWDLYAWNGSTCGGANHPPPTAYSGTHMWGTRLNTCYQNLGNNQGYSTCTNTVPGDDSILTLTVDLTGYNAATLSWWDWYDLFSPWDWGEVYANGTLVFQHCYSTFTQPTQWIQRVADLTPFAGGLVTIEFHMMASTVVNYAGWFMDDLMVTADVLVPEPDIEVAAPPLDASLPPDATTTITFTISNVGTLDLIWNIAEVPGVMSVDVGGVAETSPRSAQPVILDLEASGGGPSPAAEWNPDADVLLQLDDGSRENDIGLGGTIEMLWVNRFTPDPTLFPFFLDGVSVYFSSIGLVNVGDDMLLILYENTSGNSDPAVGSNFLASFPVTVQALDAWNTYVLPAPVNFMGPGDVVVGLIGMETPGTSYWPASMDQTATQQRSWAGWWNASPPPTPPLLPPENWTLIDVYFPGNWMVRAAGETIIGVDVPWLSEVPVSGTLTPGSTVEVEVTFDSTGMSIGDYYASLDISSNDPDEPSISLPAHLEVFGEPEIEIDAPPLDSVQLPDTQVTIPISICNIGVATLDWIMTEVSGTVETAPQAVLWDNGPLVTHPGGGYNGEDASALQTALGLNTYGFGNQYLNGYRMADDFVVDGTGWQVDQVTFFGYQTGTYAYPPVPTITGLYFQIWDGSPDDPGSTVVFGDLTTNRLASTTWPGMYRVLDTAMMNTQRPTMANVGTAGVFLPPGTYWLDWMTDGSLASGPWAPPISILGQTTTGNALQYTTSWAPALDTGLSTQQGLPFIVEGTASGTVDVPWLSENPIIGSVDPGTCMSVDITFDSMALAAGLYVASLDISSNDLDEPVINLPVSLQVGTPAIELVKTVGTDSSVCAITDEITVDEGTTVYYCYTVTNVGDITLDIHDLEDDILGPILIDFPYDLMPGASAWITTSVVVNADVTNLGTWTGYIAGLSAEATDTAIVHVNLIPDVFWVYLPTTFKTYP